jgi:misacylated tRNA(Ala) deacylase
MTEPLFRTDSYLEACEATVAAINERGGIVLDRTVFYATSGGQPGDRGWLGREGTDIAIATTVYDADRHTIVHVPASPQGLPAPGQPVTARLDWALRHRHMRVHTALHLLCSLVPFPVTGGQIAADGGRLDFDIADPDVIDKEDLTARLNRLIGENHPVADRWISDEELAANPQLVRTMSVKPPMGAGRVRLVAIGEGGEVDLQPCGGTHVRATGEIGGVLIERIENKGRQNRRIRLALLEAPPG